MTEKAMSKKQKHMMEAARLRYMEDCSNQEIADRLGLAEKTIRNYFSQEDMDQFKRFYSDQELFKLQQTLESEIRDGYKMANNLLAQSVQDEDASPRDKLKAAEQAQKIRERQIELLQKLGIIDVPDGTEHGNSSEEDVDLMERMQQAYREQQKNNQSLQVEGQ